METFIQILEADDLESVIFIPPEMQHGRLEVTLRILENEQVEKRQTFNINKEIMQKFLEAAELGEAKEHLQKKLAEGTQFTFDTTRLINGTMTEDDWQNQYAFQKQVWSDAAAEKTINQLCLSIYASSKFDIVDCLIAGYAKVNGYPVLTFDNNLKKELAEQVYIP